MFKILMLRKITIILTTFVSKTNNVYSPTNLKKQTILSGIVGFLKFVSKIQQLICKRSQKNN